jgi:hypothetical protein
VPQLTSIIGFEETMNKPLSVTIRRPALILAALAVLALCACAGAGAGGAQVPGAPEQKAKLTGKTLYWGAQIGSQLTGTLPPWDMRPARKFEQIAGKRMSIISFSASFVSCAGSKCSYNEFPTTPLQAVRDHGSIPLYSWSSAKDSGAVHQPAFQLRDVAAGRYDRYIRRNARAAKAWGHPFFLRFDWEPNGFWFPWGVRANGNRTGDYVRAWRHVHDIFTRVGANNVSWVWCPNVDLHRRARSLRPLYPGNRYVDWTCMDGFNWGNRRGSLGWLPFRRIFGGTYRRIRALAPRKPVILAEMASSDRGGSKSAWIRNALHVMATDFSGIRAFVWLDVQDRGTNWPIEHSGAGAFRKGIARPAYLPNRFGGLSRSPIPAPPRH